MFAYHNGSVIIVCSKTSLLATEVILFNSKAIFGLYFHVMYPIQIMICDCQVKVLGAMVHFLAKGE